MWNSTIGAYVPAGELTQTHQDLCTYIHTCTYICVLQFSGHIYIYFFFTHICVQKLRKCSKRTASRQNSWGHLRRARAGIQPLLNIHPVVLSRSKLTRDNLNKSTNWFSSVGIPNERGNDRRRRPCNGIYFRLYRSELICYCELH